MAPSLNPAKIPSYLSCYLYSFYLRAIKGYRPTRLPDAPWHNAVLKNSKKWKDALKQTKSLSLPAHHDSPKNWDGLAMLDYILKNTDKNANVLEAGALCNTQILPSLFLFGYKNLTGINSVFKRKFRRGTITYGHGDITNTGFPDETFDAVICQSIIEHVMDLQQFFNETSRILKPGGISIISTDYYKDYIDTGKREAFDAPVKIFSKKEIENIFDMASRYGLELTSPIDLECEERPIRWLGLSFTFLIFTMRKKGS